jgi:hypothetical protein
MRLIEPLDLLAASLLLAAGAGFVAGKTDLDIKIRAAIRNQRLAIAQDNANILVDTLEKRKLGIPVASS